jgi:hypothetical protein
VNRWRALNWRRRLLEGITEEPDEEVIPILLKVIERSERLWRRTNKNSGSQSQ